jgi:hypothetical protein
MSIHRAKRQRPHGQTRRGGPAFLTAAITAVVVVMMITVTIPIAAVAWIRGHNGGNWSSQ